MVATTVRFCRFSGRFTSTGRSVGVLSSSVSEHTTDLVMYGVCLWSDRAGLRCSTAMTFSIDTVLMGERFETDFFDFRYTLLSLMVECSR